MKKIVFFLILFNVYNFSVEVMAGPLTPQDGGGNIVDGILLEFNSKEIPLNIIYDYLRSHSPLPGNCLISKIESDNVYRLSKKGKTLVDLNIDTLTNGKVKALSPEEKLISYTEESQEILKESAALAYHKKDVDIIIKNNKIITIVIKTESSNGQSGLGGGTICAD